ncbi:MAG: hypothetical protein M3442_15120 [Chloroflexota bacterium]|nr:hypothetical protein [Chloroflexota bacterium]
MDSLGVCPYGAPRGPRERDALGACPCGAPRAPLYLAALASASPAGAGTLLPLRPIAAAEPRVAALGVLLYSCAVQALDDASLPPDLSRVDHVLTDAELELLPDAVRYRPAVIAARTFAESIEEGVEESIERHASRDAAPQPQAWWQRYIEAEDVAARARDILACGLRA